MTNATLAISTKLVQTLHLCILYCLLGWPRLELKEETMTSFFDEKWFDYLNVDKVKYAEALYLIFGQFIFF